MELFLMAGNQMHRHVGASFMSGLTTKNFGGVNDYFPLDAKSVMAL